MSIPGFQFLGIRMYKYNQVCLNMQEYRHDLTGLAMVLVPAGKQESPLHAIYGVRLVYNLDGK